MKIVCDLCRGVTLLPGALPIEVMRFGRENINFGQDDSPPSICLWPRLTTGSEANEETVLDSNAAVRQ